MLPRLRAHGPWHLKAIDMANPTTPQCLFCQIVRRDIPCYAVFEDDVSLAFLDHRPLFPGHCLLVPKLHYNTLIDLPSTLVTPLFVTTRMLASAMEQGLEAHGSFVAINNRISQSVPHLHIHIVPRRRQDGLKGFFWPRQPYRDEEAIRRVQQTLQAAISELHKEFL
jgi:histidine triad (HIT) family protein